MEGFYANEFDGGIVGSGPASEDIKLLAKCEEMEIMTQRLSATSTVWLGTSSTCTRSRNVPIVSIVG